MDVSVDGKVGFFVTHFRATLIPSIIEILVSGTLTEFTDLGDMYFRKTINIISSNIKIDTGLTFTAEDLWLGKNSAPLVREVMITKDFAEYRSIRSDGGLITVDTTTFHNNVTKEFDCLMYNPYVDGTGIENLFRENTSPIICHVIKDVTNQYWLIG